MTTDGGPFKGGKKYLEKAGDGGPRDHKGGF